MTAVVRFIRTVDDFRAAVTIGVTAETRSLEFKVALDGLGASEEKVRTEKQLELCRDISQFANSDGGCLLVGIEEGTQDGRKVATAIRGLKDIDGCKQWIETAMSKHFVPSTFSPYVDVVEVEDKQIIAVNVATSVHLVWVWNRGDGKMQAMRRTSHGKEYLNPDDVERHLMDGSRAARLELARVQSVAQLEREIALVPGVYMWNPMRAVMTPHDTRVLFRGANEHQFDLWLPDAKNQIVSIPYSMLRAAWTTADQRLGLELSVRLVFADGVLRLERV